jgi:hypothetical protein
MAFNLWDHLRLDAVNLLGLPVGLVALAGVLMLRGSGFARRLWPVWAAGALMFLSFVPVFYSERYSLVLVPVYAALAGVALGSMRFAFALRAHPGVWLRSALGLAVLALSLGHSVQVQRRTIDQLPVEVIDAARALRSLAAPGDRVIARKPHLAFHAHVEAAPFPFTETLPELAAAAKREHARWLFVSWPEVETRPRYWFLLDTAGVVPGLTPRHLTHPHPSVLYEIGPEFGQVPAWFRNDTTLAWRTARAQLMVLPNDPRALYTLGLVENSRGQLDSAEVHLREALLAQPRYLRALLLLGQVLLQKNDPIRAATAYERALRVDATSVDALVGAGWAALLQQHTDEAASLWRGVVGQTEDPQTLVRMMQLFESLGDHETAARASARLRALAGPR